VAPLTILSTNSVGSDETCSLVGKVMIQLDATHMRFNVHTVHIRRIRRKNQQYALIVPLLFLRVGSYMFRQ
jgi:hypothetical protein